jgi:UV DNA damage endonuclease
MPAQTVIPLPTNLRWGLCCKFMRAPIRFRTTTATSLLKLDAIKRRSKLSQLCLSNAASLLSALEFCSCNGIGSFRIPSCILPIKTHPEVGYEVKELPGAVKIIEVFRRCKQFAAEHGLRTTFHPDQFVVLNSPNANVVDMSLAELEYHAEVAEWVGADVINIHGGGAYGDKSAALARFARNVDRLSNAARSRLTVENDDKLFTPRDLLPVCRAMNVPLVYDVHHHRCHADGLSMEAATSHALSTWNREPLFHVSSPRGGWRGAMPGRHHDYIKLGDFPWSWRNLTITVEVEAKAKELAVLRLMRRVAAQQMSEYGKSAEPQRDEKNSLQGCDVA